MSFIRYKILTEKDNNDPNLSSPKGELSYWELLKDTRWKEKCDFIKQRDGFSCRVCKVSENLIVHHRQYRFLIDSQRFVLPWENPESELITLCDSCHKQGHIKFDVPIIYI